MYKILVCGLTPNMGGLERVVLNFFRYMNKDKFHLDFICTEQEKVAFWEDFEKMSKNKIEYYYPPKRKDNPVKYKKELEKIFAENAEKYDAVWLNALSLTNIEYLKLAKKYGIEKIVVHSHNSDMSDGGIRLFLHKLNKPFIKNYATDFWSCSDEATEWMFPKRIHSKVEWIHNAIDVDKFLFNEETRIKYQVELGIGEDEFVIGNVARIDYQKNQEFILEVFAEVLKRKENSRLVLVGGGDDSALKKQATDLGILDKILFLGMRDDVPALYNIFDFFLFPSRFEGLPVSLLEVQANGLPTLVSDVITKQVIVNSNYDSLDLDIYPSTWAEKVLVLSKLSRIDSEIIKKDFIAKNFEIREETKRLETLFLGTENK